jgi:AcrR family transcriptional regulator
MMLKSDHCRRERVLDAAEAVFAECGFAGASLRRIVLEARVNLATVYYYFGSKNGLMEAVLKRRFGPLREEHLDRLRRAEEGAAGRPVGLEQILEAMLLPPLHLALTPSPRSRAVTRLIGRIVTEPDRHTQQILRSQRAPVRDAFLRALGRTLPKIPSDVLRWRLEFAWGALALILCNPHKLELETHGERNPVDAERVVAEMIAFFSPAFQAPAGEVHGRARTKRIL